MAEVLLGIDIGTSAVKVAAFRRNGQPLASCSALYPFYRPFEGFAEQDPEDWYRGVCDALSDLWKTGIVSPKDVAAVGIDGQGWSAIAVDKDGNSIGKTPIWFDTRATDECSYLINKIGEDNIFNLSGNVMNPSYTTAKVLWLKKNAPEIYAKTSKIMHSNGYIGLKLTGNITDDVSNAYGWHCFDMKRAKWDFDMAREMEIPASFLPELVNCDSVIGKITKKAASETGLHEGTPVVAGGLDAACGTLGPGVIDNGQTQEQGGQAGGMSICLSEYKADKRLILSYHVVPGKWLLQGGTTGGGGAMNWFVREFEEGTENTLDRLNLLASKVKPGSDGLIFLPYMNGERSPIWNPKAKGVYFGLDFGKTKGHAVRALMEGVAFSLRHNIEAAENAGATVGTLRSMGGAANSRLWTQIKADVTGKTIEVSASDTATALGAAILAGVGTGFYDSYEAAVKETVKITRVHEPNSENKEVYDNNYKNYLKIYENLKELMV